MNISDETLMRYADGELDAQQTSEVEAAIRSDPTLAQRVEEHRALRARLGGAFDGVLAEPIPDRLLMAANAAPRTNVTDLASARAAKQVERPARRWAWKEWTAIAASVLMGVFVGRTVLQAPDSALVETRGHGLVAAGSLADALTRQVGGERPPDASIAIAATFRNQAGEYCRAFTAREPEALAGVACRDEDVWRVHTLTQGAAGASNEYRMAGSPLPAIVLQTMESMMVGDALDEDDEALARERMWLPQD